MTVTLGWLDTNIFIERDGLVPPLQAFGALLVIPAILALAGCGDASLVARSGGFTTAPALRPTAVAAAVLAARVLLPYHDLWHTFEMGRPQTWIALDARSSPRYAAALGDGVRFFEPVTNADPDAASSGKMWVEVLPAQRGSTPQQVLLQPFIAADYPASLLRRMRLAPYRLGSVAGYRLVTLNSRTQVTLLLARWRGYYYRVTIFGPTIPIEVQRALRTWRFV